MTADEIMRLWELAILSAAGLVGALGTYAGMILFDHRARRRRRKAIATAMLAELSWMTNAITQGAELWTGQDLTINYLRPTHDQFTDHADLFSADTARAVLSFMAHVADLRRWVDKHREMPPSPERDRVYRNVKRFAERTLQEAERARVTLEKEGGEWTSISVVYFDTP